MADERKNGDKPRWAADEPTAMWDGGALDPQGPSEAGTPAPRAGGDPPQDPATAARPAPSGLSWPMTIAIAIVVGVAVFLLVRALRG